MKQGKDPHQVRSKFGTRSFQAASRWLRGFQRKLPRLAKTWDDYLDDHVVRAVDVELHLGARVGVRQTQLRLFQVAVLETLDEAVEVLADAAHQLAHAGSFRLASVRCRTQGRIVVRAILSTAREGACWRERGLLEKDIRWSSELTINGWPI
eukprot:1176223-Prorocentrum_minimum.AAC.7